MLIYAYMRDDKVVCIFICTLLQPFPLIDVFKFMVCKNLSGFPYISCFKDLLSSWRHNLH